MKSHLIPEPQPLEPQREHAEIQPLQGQVRLEPALPRSLTAPKLEPSHHSADGPMRGFLRAVFAS